MNTRHAIRIGHLSSWHTFAIGVSIYLVTAAAALAQSGECGTVMTQIDIDRAAELAKLLEEAGVSRSDNHYSIPVAMHIVRSSSGTGGLSVTELNDAFDSANVLFVQANVDIYEYQSVNFIDEDYFFFDMSTGAKMDSLKRYDKVPQAVNIYWVPSASGFPYCGLSSFTTSGVQGIIMNNACGGTLSKNSTLVHEIGHYFDLYHTHETAFGTECPNGSNCGSAGDLICDTPADPVLSGHVDVPPLCTYDDFAAPPGSCDATPYDPPVFNIMSYSRQSCRDEFTPLQIDKYRFTLETLRPELAFYVNDLEVFPLAVEPLVVPLSNSRDTSLYLENHGSVAVTISSAITSFGEIDIVSGIPISLNPTENSFVVIEFDASLYTTSCDLGVITDTLILDVTSPTTYSIRIPVKVELAYAVPTQPYHQFGTNCLQFTVPNTPAIGDRTSSALVDDGGNVLYDASLLLGVVDGSDTTVYMDVFNQAEFLNADEFISGTDSFGRTTQTLRFATADARLTGDVLYHYGDNSGGVDSCAIIEVEYRLRNECDTALFVATGMMGDFDIVSSSDNNAQISIPDELVYVEYGSHVAGFANLAACKSDRGLQPISNPQSIYPNNGLVDGEAFQMLRGGNGSALFAQDVSVLLSFGMTNLLPGTERVFRAAILASTSGTAAIITALNDLKAMHGSQPCYLEVPFDYATIQSAIDAANDGEVVSLAPGTYTGPGNVDLDFLGKKITLLGSDGANSTIIDCNGTPGDPHRGFRFDDPDEDSNTVVEGITVRNGLAPADGPNARADGGAAIIMSGAAPKFQNCVFDSNTCDRSGGAISVENASSATIDNCTFTANSAPIEWGGAIWTSPGTSPIIRNSSFEGNSAEVAGAIAIDNNGGTTIESCRFTGNFALFGGAIIGDAANPQISFCTFDQNYATTAAGVCYFFNNSASVLFTNCTFARNYVTPPSLGAASVAYSDSADITLENCIVFANHGDEPLICSNGGSFSISCTDIFGNASGDWTGCVASQSGNSGNFSLDPLFCDTTNGDFRVASSSPCAPANNSCAVLIGAGGPACGNTPAGSDVVVPLGDVQVTFTTVTQDGETSLTLSDSGPNPPGGFAIVPSNPEIYYDLATTAPYAGDIEVCINYNPAAIGAGSESDLKMFHYDAGNWVDITSSLDEGNDLLCGATDHFSQFIVAIPTYICGDADGSQLVTISDAVYMINYIFAGGPSPAPLASGDADCSGILTISDAVYLINYIFAGGPAPCSACS